MTPLRLAFSPCPNDTFVFHALVHGLLPGAPPVTVTYADVDVTNTAALGDGYDVVKVSYAALPWLLDRYALLPCGGAVGRGCGPLVLTRGARPAEPPAGPPDEPAPWVGAPGGPAVAAASAPGAAAVPGAGAPGDAAAASLAGATVAVPGDRTTAYLLFRLWSQRFPPGRIEVRPFETIMPAVADGTVDAGLVIHEARFTYPRYGLHALVDLGDWWEAGTGLPIPLGAILTRRDLPGRTGVTVEAVADLVRASVRAAWADPAASRDYVAAHAQELDPAVTAAHIALYVNDFTADLGDAGYAAAAVLLDQAARAGLVPPLPQPLR